MLEWLAVHHVRQPFIWNTFVLEDVQRLVLATGDERWMESAAHRLRYIVMILSVESVLIGARQRLNSFSGAKLVLHWQLLIIRERVVASG